MKDRDDARGRQADKEGDFNMPIFTIIRQDTGSKGENTVDQTILARGCTCRLCLGR